MNQDLMGWERDEVEGLVGVLAEVGLGEGLYEGVWYLEAEGEEVALFMPKAWRWVHGLGRKGEEVVRRYEQAGFFGELSGDGYAGVFAWLYHPRRMLVKGFWSDRPLLPHHEEGLSRTSHQVHTDGCEGPPMDDEPFERAVWGMQGDLLDGEKGMRPEGLRGGFEEVGSL